ncbi:MAG: hypothetical protein K5877_09040 [Lachnospiraceae bacterium]|nr:hypothetical protein [Lachnospiraceae bacterium]
MIMHPNFYYYKFIEFVLLFAIPIGILVKSFLRKRFMTTFSLTYYIASIPLIGAFEGAVFSFAYIVAFGAFMIWWSSVFQKYKEENPNNYEEFRYYYSEYFADDLNNDGIKDAFENWEIAHDPRFFWLFGSRRAKQKKALENQSFDDPFLGAANFFDQQDIYSHRSKARAFESEFKRKYSNGSSGATDNRTYRNTQTGGPYSNAQNSRSYGTSQNTGAYRKNYDTRQKPESEMSDVEKEVAKQHEFARRYNLRYFAMCKSKSEAKKLYHKYAAKFHPDNAVTGDKDKFVKIDEEYNRFCQISEIS